MGYLISGQLTPDIFLRFHFWIYICKITEMGILENIFRYLITGNNQVQDNKSCINAKSTKYLAQP